MEKYAICKLCKIEITEEYLNGRTPTEAISDHLENDHSEVLNELESEINPNSDTTGLSLAWDFYIQKLRNFD